MRCLAPFLFVLFAAHAVTAAEVTDATGRTVKVPDRISRVLSADPPAAVLLAAIAPEQTMGFTARLSDRARVALPRDHEIAALDADYIILADPAAKRVLTSPAWSSLRAVRDGHAVIAPSVPFGWIEEPPSINRLLGLAWLRGSDPVALATLFNATVYGRVVTSCQLTALVPASSKP